MKLKVKHYTKRTVTTSISNGRCQQTSLSSLCFACANFIGLHAINITGGMFKFNKLLNKSPISCHDK